MTMQTSEKFARNAKSKAKGGGYSKKMQAVKEENTTDVAIKLERQVDPERTDDTTIDSRKFNGHLENQHQDQDVPILPPSSMRPPTRDVTPTSHQMLVGPNGQMGGPPPNCLAPVGPQMPQSAMGPGGQMQLSAGGHFLQSHNQVFVFSTAMANHAAQLVKSGQFKNIIDFHVNHPDTQQFLQKCSMSSPLPGMTMNMRMDGSMRQPGVPDAIPESGSALANVAQWVQQQNANLQQLSSHSSGVSFSSPPDGQSLRPNGRYGRMIQQWGGSSPGPQTQMPPDMVIGGPQGYAMCGPQQGFPPDMNIGGPSDMLHGSVPKENLTPQQLQKREEGLAHLRKIGQMLNIDSSGGPGPGPMMHMHGNPDGTMPGDGWPGGPMMHPNMGVARPRMAMSPTDAMMGMNFTPQRMGPFVGPGGLPPDWDSMSPEQKDWHKMQHEFYLEKCRKQQMQMGMNVPPGSGGGGPNRPHMGFFHPMQQMHRMPGGPMSPVPPGFQGGPVSSPHCGPMVNPNDPQAMMFAKQQSEYGGMCPGGGMGPDPNFDHMGAVPRDGMFPFPDGPMPSGRLGSMSGESFSPAEFSHPTTVGQPGGMVKMTPNFGGPQKRKRSANTMSDPEDIYKRLLPAPSPQQFSYMNSLDGQELTITKQLNHAFQEQSGAPLPPPPSSSPATYPPPQKSRSSGSKKKKTQPKSDAKSKLQRTPPAADPFTCPSPAVPAATTSASFQSVPAASPISQTSVSSLSSSLANVVSTPTANRASSADPNSGPPHSSVAITTVATPLVVIKSSMTNITSASLANLAKGVENLSAQIQHNPFRTVQMQENESDVSDVSPPDNSSLLLPPSGSHGPANPQNMGGPIHPGNSISMQQQQMTPTHMMGSPPGSVRSASHPKPGSAGGLTDPAGLFGRQSSPIFPGDDPGLDPASRFCFTGAMPLGGQQMYSSQMGPSPGGASGCRPTNGGNMVTGNAKIQIQAQTPNTIQYLPSSGGHPGDGGMGDGFIDFQMDGKPCGKGGGMPSYGAMMDGIHGSMMSGEMMIQQRRQMDLQMMQEAGGGQMHAQMRMDAAFDQMHGPPRGSMHGPRGSGPGGPMHMTVGSIHGPGSPILTSSGMMHGMGNAMHGPGSPRMGPSGSMHGQTSPMMGPGSMMGPGGHMGMGELLQMQQQGHMKQGMGLNGGGDFGQMVMARGGEMMQDMGPMGISHRSMHPDAMMMSGASPPEFAGPHRGDPGMMGMMSGCGGMMGPEMGMQSIGGREGMITMRGAPGMRPEMLIERSRSNRSRQKARAAEAVESRMRNEAAVAAGMMVGDGGGGRGQGGMNMDMMGMMRSEMGMMGMRADMMGMQGMGDRMGMRPEQGMMLQRGNGMPPEMAMMGSRSVTAGRMAMMEGMPQDGMFTFGPGRRGMPPEAMEMMSPGMNPAGMCPPGMKSMVMGGSGMGQPPGSGMGPDPGGYGVPYQQFQQQLYAQSRSPTMSPGMMRGGMPGGPGDMMGRPQYEVMGPGPGMTPGSGFGQPGLGSM